MIKLSIIVPVYNVEQYIEKCIRSLYNQDIPASEYEVLCVDDCSPDQSAAIIERLQKEYPTLHLIRHEHNKKLGGARNTGLRNAQGQYIMYVDSDDMLYSNSLGLLVKEMDRLNDDYIYFNMQRLFPDNQYEPIKHHSLPNNQMTGADLFFCNIIPWEAQISACSKIYRRDFLLRNDLFFIEGIMYEDNDYAMRVAAAATKCRYIDTTPYIYRQIPTSTTHNSDNYTRMLYWQATWPHINALFDTIGNKDERFVELIKAYLRMDVCHVMDRIDYLPREQRIAIIKNLSFSQWRYYLHFLPWKRRIKYINKMITSFVA